MARSPSQRKDDPSRHISARATLQLWVRSGGRCAMCNKFLLEEPFFERPINLGERAHVAGWSTAAGSPRGDSSLPVEERNEAKNLVLLCLDCHTIVDDKRTRADYSEGRLLVIKQEHEDRVFHLTSMTADRETAVLRVFGSVRGSTPELARDAAIEAVKIGSGRYARFPLAPDRHSVEVDLTRLPDPEKIGMENYWITGCQVIDGVATLLAQHVQQKQIRHLSVFALARIPLLVHLGYALGDKAPVELYQKQRGGDEGWLWSESDPPISFEVSHTRENDTDEIAVIMSLSGVIPEADLPAIVQSLTRFEIRPVGVDPNAEIFKSSATLEEFRRAYLDLLARLEQTKKKARLIHLFPAVPITAAITCGRSLMRHVHPAVLVYERIGNEFQPAITINSQ